jgi:hypothetical protein
LLVDTSLFQPADAQLLERLLVSEFVVRDQQGSVVLAERIRAPANATGPP